MNQDYTFDLAYPFNADIAITELFPETYDDSEFFGEGLFDESFDLITPPLD